MKNTQIRTRITDFLFDSIEDPRIERYMRKMERKAAWLHKKYHGRTNYLKKLELFIEFLEDLFQVLELFGEDKVSLYFNMQSDLYMYDEKIKALKLHYQERRINAYNLIYFYRFVLAKVSKKKQKEFLRARRVSKYRYWLLSMFDKEGVVSEKEDDLMNLLEEPAYDNWTLYSSNVQTRLTLRFSGKNLSINRAAELLEKLRGKKRYVLNDLIDKKYRTAASVVTQEWNSIVKYQLICSEHRGYKHPYSENLAEYEIDEASMMRLINYLNELFPKITHRFHAMHAQSFGKKSIPMCDSDLPVGKVRKNFKFIDALDWYYKGMKSVDPQLARLIMKYFYNGQIDVYSRKGKDSNSYSVVSDGGKHFGFAILDLHKGMTFMEFLQNELAHEGGHLGHGELNKHQPVVYRDLSPPIGETAAFFYDRVCIDYYIQSLSTESERLGALHFLLDGLLGKIFYQTMLFNFGVELHQAVKEKKFLSTIEMVKIMKKHLEIYYGPAVRVTENDAFSTLAIIPRNLFYECSYTFAGIFHLIQFVRWKQDKSYYGKIKKSFSAGSSDDAAGIMKLSGINIDNPKLFDTAIGYIVSMLDEFETLMLLHKK